MSKSEMEGYPIVPQAAWPPTPQSLLTKPLGEGELTTFDATFTLLPPPLLPHPAMVYAPHLVCSSQPIVFAPRAEPASPACRSETTHQRQSEMSATDKGKGRATQPPTPRSLSEADMADADATEDDDAYQPVEMYKAGSSKGHGAARPSAAKKASHSVIERRRRERINDTLARLVELVPGCKSVLQAKDEKSARSRRRQRKATGTEAASALNVGGLHKLDVLLATVEHIEELHKRLGLRTATLSNAPHPAPASVPAKSQPLAPAIVSATEDVESAAASLLALASPTVAPTNSPAVQPSMCELQI